MTMSLREAFDAVADLTTSERQLFYREHAVGALEVEELERLVAATQQPLSIEEPLLDLERVLRKAPLAGTRLGRWRLLEPLGRGGMGVVWRAERDDGRVEQTVAIKLLDQPLDPSLQARIALERNILARLDHPGIGRFIDAGEDVDGHPYFAMELIAGKAIDQWADETRRTVRERVQAVCLLLEALAHAHAQLVVHRDLKCSNVLVANGGQPKLIDFGIARNLGNHTDTRLYGRFLTLRNAAPEQLLGQSIGTGVDIYGAGLVLYELLCGVHPFAGDYTRSGELEQRILDESPLPPSRNLQKVQRSDPAVARELAIRRGLPSSSALAGQLRGDLDAIVDKSLAKNASDRYTTAEAFANDLRCWLEGMPVRVRRSSRWYRVRKFVLRHRLAVAAVAVFVFGLLTLSAFLWQARTAAGAAQHTAEQTAAFLVGVFTSSDPEHNQGNPPSALDLLNQAVAQLPASSGLTHTNAPFNLAISEALLGLGQPARALEALPNKLDLYLDGPSRLRAGLVRARAALEAGDAVRALELAHALNEASVRSGDEEIALSARFIMARAHLQMDRREEGMVEARLLLRQIGRARAEMPDWKLRVLGETLWFASGGSESQDPETYQALTELLAQLKSRFGERHQTVATQLTRLARLDRAASRLDLALHRQREALTIIESIYGKGHPQTGRMLNSLANIETEIGNRGAALQLYQRALGIYLDGPGARHPMTTMLKLNIGMQLLFTGRAQESLAVLREAEKVAVTHWDVAGTNYGVLSLTLAAAELENRDLETAEARMTAASKAARAGNAEKLILWADSLRAHLLFLRGQTDQARQLLSVVVPAMSADERYFGGFLQRSHALQLQLEASVRTRPPVATAVTH